MPSLFAALLHTLFRAGMSAPQRVIGSRGAGRGSGLTRFTTMTAVMDAVKGCSLNQDIMKTYIMKDGMNTGPAGGGCPDIGKPVELVCGPRSMSDIIEQQERAASRAQDDMVIDAFRNGDNDAFKLLFDKYFKRIFCVVYGMIGNMDDAKDICQEIFIKVSGAISGYKGTSAFYTWIYRVAVNASLDFKRKMAAKHGFITHDEASLQNVEAEPDCIPSRAAAKKEFSRRMKEIIQTLPPEQKAALFLKIGENLSYREIAQIQGCSTGTVMSRLHLARKKIAQALKETA